MIWTKYHLKYLVFLKNVSAFNTDGFVFLTKITKSLSLTENVDSMTSR